MKTPILISLISLLVGQTMYGQKRVDGTFRIYLATPNYTSANGDVPIVLEEEQPKNEVLYTYNGLDAVKTTKEYTTISDNFKFNNLNAFNYKSIEVKLEHKENKLIIIPTGTVKTKFDNYNSAAGNNRKRRLYIDVTDPVVITRAPYGKFSALTVPVKAYLGDLSDSLENFTNNIQSDVNISITYGVSLEKYSFNKNGESQLTSTKYFFGFAGFQKIELNKKNSDGRNEGDNILGFNFGIGAQFGYGKLGASVLIGSDIPIPPLGSNWVFRYVPWIGIGVGYSLFK